ncbi:MAG: prolipoprotein diacylglyceryl transferase [Oscillospiraceae bacterium]|nr:prolipoprotein diacylglyceryl transferase [Oscillospiraceae bacterium]
MKDYSVVYFKAIERGFSIPSTLCEFSIAGIEFSIKLYGLLIAIGYLVALVTATKLAKRKGIDVDKLYDAIIFGTLGGIIGARAYYVLFNLGYYLENPSHILKITEGGLAIYGGIIGALFVGFIVCKIRKISVLDVFDLAAVGFLAGQGIGRWGNFTNQEAFGVNTNLPWGMKSETVREYILFNQSYFQSKGITMDPDGFVHPTFLYESIWCILGFILFAIMFDKYRKFKGQIALTYGVWYGIERTVVEGLRIDSLYIANTNIRVSQVLSAVLLVCCLIGLIVGFVRTRKNETKTVAETPEYIEEKSDETEENENIEEC